MADYYVDLNNGNDTTGDGSEGDPWLTLPKAIADSDNDDVIYARGSGLVDSMIVSAVRRQFIGYATTPGDHGKATLTADASIEAIFQFNNRNLLQNFIFDGDGQATGCVVGGSGDRRAMFVACDAHSSNIGFDLGDGTTPVTLSLCRVRDTASDGISGSTGTVRAYGCAALDCGGTGMTGVVASHCIAVGNNVGFVGSSGFATFGCIAYGNTTDGISLSGSNSSYTAIGCISVNNGGSAFACSTNQSHVAGLYRCVDYGNAGGRVNNNARVIDVDPIALSGDPFVNAPAGNFNLNDVAGAGAVLRAIQLGVPT